VQRDRESGCFVDQHVRREDGGGGLACRAQKIDAKRDRGLADFLHCSAHRDAFAGAQGQEKLRLRAAQRCGVQRRSEPIFPAHVRMPHEVFDRLVGEGKRARVKDDAGRVGVAEGEVHDFFPTDHASKKRKQCGLGMSKCAASCLTLGAMGGILRDTLDQTISRALERRRSARHAARRRQGLVRVLMWASAIFIVLAFAGGFTWRSGWLRKPAAESAPVTVGAAERAEAYRVFDEAVRARHEERLQGAYNAINEARRLDPDLPGIDLFVGEIAWEQREADTVQRAARESLRRGHHESAAKLLLALEKWMSRTPQDTTTVGASVRELLAEAGEASPSNAAALFFHGELSRLLGDSATAHRTLLGALHRQTPWSSTALLASKLQLAAAEASQLGRTVFAPAPDDAAQAALDLRTAVLAGRDPQTAFDQCLGVTPALQAKLLLQDDAFDEGVGGAVVRSLHEQIDWSSLASKIELRKPL
jgi:hypothetical protein